MSEVNQLKKLAESLEHITESTKYDVEVHWGTTVVLKQGEQEIAKIDIDDWKLLTNKVISAVRNYRD